MELDGRVLVLKRIHVRYVGLTIPDDQRDAALRAHDAHADHCPVARSLKGCIEITTEVAESITAS